jgi:hypothetical protein
MAFNGLYQVLLIELGTNLLEHIVSFDLMLRHTK